MLHDSNEQRLSDLELALAALTPSAGHINRDRLMYAAGRRSAGRRWTWQLTCGLLTLATVWMGAAWFLRAGAPPTDRIVYVPLSVAPGSHEAMRSGPEDASTAVQTPSIATTGGVYLHMRDDVLRWGADYLAPKSAMPTTHRSPLRLGEVYDTTEDDLHSINGIQISVPDSAGH
jgi:hypothetical protein